MEFFLPFFFLHNLFIIYQIDLLLDKLIVETDGDHEAVDVFRGDHCRANAKLSFAENSPLLDICRSSVALGFIFKTLSKCFDVFLDQLLVIRRKVIK
jgi:hypothetical protein